ncbi:glycosyltransferase family protein [Photobacterium leiognathi]|uniref:hypothetical protein n=1 Tax=Photobacterium leiognathi TaxID=553611 RepID=UPI002981D2F1|nr:hypothetical protein [Photobacterium leiognathi]
MSIKISSIVRTSAYYPEIYAYKDYFNSIDGVEFNIIHSNNINDLLSTDADCYIIKIGFDSKFNYRLKGKLYIHDYTSCSTGKYPKLKNYIKKCLNYNADIKLFLNERVMNEYHFSQKNNHLIRDMGIDDFFFYNGEKKGEHDFIYAGSIDKSRNIEKVLHSFKLSSRELSLIGEPSNDIYKEFKGVNNIKFLGKLDRYNTAKELKKAEYGVNITPSIYPYDFQTSTKTLEYCAAQLKIVCNTNSWNRSFERKEKARFFYTEDFKIPSNINEIDFIIPDVSNYRWHKVIEESGLPHIIFDRLK